MPVRIHSADSGNIAMFNWFRPCLANDTVSCCTGHGLLNDPNFENNELCEMH
jgi:hypothetical protein